MCRCGKPNVNGTPGAYSWDGETFMTRQPMPPDLADRDELIWDEPGRCGGIDAHSYHFHLIKRYSSHVLLVRHGGGQESVGLPCTFDLLLANLSDMTSDAALSDRITRVEVAVPEMRDDISGIKASQLRIETKLNKLLPVNN